MTETMTLRKAIAQRKLLDKQIKKIMDDTKFICVHLVNEEIIDGQSVKTWKETTSSTWQSLNDKIIRRNALDSAIVIANATHKVKVPKFASLEPDDKTGSEMEEITYASAIGRKKYFTEVIDKIISNLNKQIRMGNGEYDMRTRDSRRYVDNRLEQEFKNTTNASSKQREEREAKLLRDNTVVLEDPVSLAPKIKKIQEKIENYLETIDSILGRETELTEIVIEY